MSVNLVLHPFVKRYNGYETELFMRHSVVDFLLPYKTWDADLR
jgi:hypothetical protein